MSPAELLRQLAGADVQLVAGSDGPEFDAAPGALTDNLVVWAQSYRWLFEWALEGARTGHAWHVCDGCDQIQLIATKRATPRKCSFTSGCKGLMRLPTRTTMLRPGPCHGEQLRHNI